MRIALILTACLVPTLSLAFEEEDTLTRKVKIIRPEVPASQLPDEPAPPAEPEYFPDEPESRGATSSSGSMTKRAKTSKRKNSIYLRLDMGTGTTFASRLGYIYGIGRYLFGELSAFYDTKYDDEFDRTTYGPELGVGAHLPNRTIFTPFLTVGPGYESWKQTYLGKTYDKGGSLTGRYVIGVTAAMTKNFGMVVARRENRYFGKTPLQRDGVSRLANPRVTYDIGFQVMF